MDALCANVDAHEIRKEALGTDNTFKQTFDALNSAADKSAKLKELLMIWNIEWQSYTSRIIGRALKGASPGMAFDIMLQRALLTVINVTVASECDVLTPSERWSSSYQA